MADTVLDNPVCDNGVTGKRKAWANSKGSWPASEAEDISAETREDNVTGSLPLAVETGNVPIEKIAIWLKDCRTPMRSLDEPYNPALKGTNLKNGSSFDDDLSLGAEANQLHPGSMQTETACNGLLAKEKRLQFQQQSRSMNSTGSGKSSATVSSVSELLDLYEEDPEEILYNLGFGTEEPDIASKIPSRFFGSSSHANGIDIKVYLNAQMQRMEVENPNYALTSRFRQIEVLTTVANAFSSLYSQVSGTPLQRIGSSATLPTDKETVNDVPPLKRNASRNTVNLLKKTITKLNLHGAQSAKDGSNSPTHPTDKGKSTSLIGVGENGVKNVVKSEQKPLKPLKRETLTSLATVKEEMVGNSLKPIGSLPVDQLSSENSNLTPADRTTEGQQPQNVLHEESERIGTSLLSKDLSLFSDHELETSMDKKKPHTSTPDKEHRVPILNPVLANLMAQQKDSFEMEEVQSMEGEVPHVPTSASSRLSKDQFYRTTSSDSSGFAEDPSADYHSINHLQVQEPLHTMGSSGDSNDSETTVTSLVEAIKTPLAQDESVFQEMNENEEFFTPVDMVEGKMSLFFTSETTDLKTKVKQIPSASEMELPSQSDCNLTSILDGAVNAKNRDCDARKDLFCKKEETELLNRGTDGSEEECGSETEIPCYTIHQLPELLDLMEDTYSSVSAELVDSSSSPINKVNVALQRAQKRAYRVSDGSAARVGRSMVKARDLYINGNELSAKNESRIQLGYPLRRTQSLPTTLLSPVRVVSSVSVRLTPGRETLCTPPLFTYKYTPEEDEYGNEDDDTSSCKSVLFISPSSVKKEASSSGPVSNKFIDESSRSRFHSHPFHGPRQLSQSTCSLHSIHSEGQERPVCEHMRTWSSSSVPNVARSSYGASPFCCPYPQGHHLHPYPTFPVNPPTAIEMQLRRVLHDIRNAVQNLSQYPMFRVNDPAAGFYNSRSSILPLYENTFQELQIMKRSLNLFRSQMMDLELNVLHQQTLVYHHLTEEERQEADQLQYLRNSVRMELQELEQQLEERIFALEEQLRSTHHHSPYRSRMGSGMYDSRSLDNLSCSSPLNVLEPVTELLREQSYLKSELGLGELDIEDTAHGFEDTKTYSAPSLASELASVCSSPTQLKRVAATTSRQSHEKTLTPSMQSKQVYRASVSLTPVPPLRTGKVDQPIDNHLSHEAKECVQEIESQRTEYTSASETHGESRKRALAESPELQEVLKEIKQSIVGDIRRELVEGLLAAVSFPVRSPEVKREECP